MKIVIQSIAISSIILVLSFAIGIMDKAGKTIKEMNNIASELALYGSKTIIVKPKYNFNLSIMGSCDPNVPDTVWINPLFDFSKSSKEAKTKTLQLLHSSCHTDSEVVTR